MEDGLNGTLSDVEVSDLTKNGVVAPIMAKFPDRNAIHTNHEKVNNFESKINGYVGENNLYENDSFSSESDALVIDENVPKKKVKRKSKLKNLNENVEDKNTDKDLVTHSNPFFNESLFELSQLHQTSQDEDVHSEEPLPVEKISKVKQKKSRGKLKPKLREYAQYLGLQPKVQFKCSKCGTAGFESLNSLQEHVIQCNAESVPDITQENLGSSFKLTRNVFLCSACGTYYENWNLYMHMLELHRRFICLYCLGMFSLLEDLCQHIQSKHNLVPGHKKTLDEFYNVYNEPCYVVCCECNKLFSEQDNFFYHHCSKNAKTKKPLKAQITPENHVTGESEAVQEISSNLDKEEPINDRNYEMEVDIVEDKNDELINMEANDNKELSDTNTENYQEPVENNISLSSSVSLSSSISTECDKTDKISEYLESNLNNELGNTQNNQEHIDPDNVNLHNVDISNDAHQHLNYRDDTKNTDDMSTTETETSVETRRVPKLSLKLPKNDSYAKPPEVDSDDSLKIDTISTGIKNISMEADQIESEYETENGGEVVTNKYNFEEYDISKHEENLDQDRLNMPHSENDSLNEESEVPKTTYYNVHLQVAGPDVPVIELELEQPLDKFDPRILLQTCLKMTVLTCIYCNHARKIAVNGKQLALHCIAEHRFSAVVNSITAEELIPESFVNRLNECLDELECTFFNLESSFSNEAVTFSHLFECFQCYFSTTVHKELYLHNRKFHSKNLLLCIMCKSNFYSYSELICHLCPGLYVLDYDLQFRCCMCISDDLPSSFRLMVHLRKKHNVCDVCLEVCHTQYKLANHVWKHKLHHFCYRCGIAYRNKPDITRHLFWKHGTESVLCKKCLQKKWPHVYHFCVPPTSFTCEECGQTLTRAVSLKVHKRIHTDEKKHFCTFEGCGERFISKKLMLKHERKHFEPPEEITVEEKIEPVEEIKHEVVDEPKTYDIKEEEEIEDKPKPKIDVLAELPALNLSESDSSDSEPETPPSKTNAEDTDNLQDFQKEETSEEKLEIMEPHCLNVTNQEQEEKILPPSIDDLDGSHSVIQNIWDNFKNYQANKEKMDSLLLEPEKIWEEVEEEASSELKVTPDPVTSLAIVLMDHDYCINPEEKTDTSIIEVKPALTLSESVDHDYCSSKPKEEAEEKPEPVPEQPPNKPKHKEVKTKTRDSSSNSSSDTESSSCSCVSNCSCSSSGNTSSGSDSSNSDSSTEEGRKKQQARRQKRKERGRKMKEDAAAKINESDKLVDVTTTTPNTDLATVTHEHPIHESDLDTTESETDEEFYDRAPQKLAKKILEEKRQQLLAIMGPNSVPNVPNGSFIESTSRPPTPPPSAGVVEEEERKKKKSKSKKRKRKKTERAKEIVIQPSTTASIIPPDVPIPPYYQQFHQQLAQSQPPTVAPITLSLSRSSPTVQTLTTPATSNLTSVYPKVQPDMIPPKQDPNDSINLRASKRRRVPNKFYGYSSDEDQEKPQHPPKWRKMDVPHAPRSPLTVPPITIKTTPQIGPPPQQPLLVEPISIRTGAHLSDFRVRRPRPQRDNAMESNEESTEDEAQFSKPQEVQLYCYCRCPYDEVSEMIGCDASDCAIEWFHFECVGIMVPPKGQWFCPDCRKKKQQKKEMMLQHSLGNT